jgi:hypothetical protein
MRKRDAKTRTKITTLLQEFASPETMTVRCPSPPSETSKSHTSPSRQSKALSVIKPPLVRDDKACKALHDFLKKLV